MAEETIKIINDNITIQRINEKSSYMACSYQPPPFKAYISLEEKKNDDDYYNTKNFVINKIVNIVKNGNLPDIMNFPNGSIYKNKTKKFNNIIYYDENINFIKSINQDSDYFEKITPGAFILCIKLDSLEIISKEIIKKNKKDKRISFNLITTGSKCEKVMNFLNKNNILNQWIENVCIYCMNIEKYQNLKAIYPKIHSDIYNKRIDVENFIHNFSSENIKPFPLTKLVTYNDYIEKYKERHSKIAEFYGDFNPRIYEKSLENMLNLINEDAKNNELKVKDKDLLYSSFTKFRLKNNNSNLLEGLNEKNNSFEEEEKKYINQDLQQLNKLIIKEYTKDTFYGDLNKWLMNYKNNGYESVAYFTARLMYSLNSYATQNKKFYNKHKKNLYRGIKIPYSCLLPYERAKGKIILLSAFTSTSENKEKVIKFSGRNHSKEIYKTNQLFSVLFIIKNISKNDWISTGINIQNESIYKEEEILYQPFSFYYLEDININLNNCTADIYLETVGKKQILEKEIKKGKEIVYNKEENIIEIENNKK